MYFNQNVWQGVSAAADWAGQFPAHRFSTMSRLERHTWEKAAKRREKVVELSRATTIGAFRHQFTERVVCSTQFGFRTVNTSTDPMLRGPRLTQMGPAQAFQAIADLEGKLARKRATLIELANKPAYNLCDSTVVTVAVEAQNLARALKEAVDVAYEWYGVNYWLETSNRA